MKYPESIFKFCSFGDYYIDALIDHYLYLSHPSKMNDIRDACKSLIGLDNINVKEYLQIVDLVKQRAPQLIGYKQHKELDPNYNKLRDTIYDVCFDFSGIISTTYGEDIQFQDNMWAHYANNDTGFLIEFQTKDLIEGIKKDYRNKRFRIIQTGYVNYKKEIDSIDCRKHNSIDEVNINIAFQKKEFWERENEYRILMISNQYLNDTYMRYAFYSEDAIRRIYLGDKFGEKIIDDEEMKSEEKWQFKIKKEDKYIYFFKELCKYKDKVYLSGECCSSTSTYKNNYKDIQVKNHPTRSFLRIIHMEVKENKVTIECDGNPRSTEEELS